MTDHLTEYKILVYAQSGESLDKDRDSLIEATWARGHYARPLRSQPGLALSKLDQEAIDAADVFVTISCDASSEVRMACDFASHHKKPVLAFLLDSDQAETGRHDEVAAFENIISHGAIGSYLQPVSGRDKLISDYLIRLDRLVRELDKRKGSARAEPEVHVSNPFVRRFVQLEQQWQVLNARCEQNSPLKRSVAAFVLDLYFARLVGAGVTRWFLESGSSTAYLAESLSTNWPRLASKLQEIETNNILAYLELVSSDSVRRFSLYPPGRPEGKYGATFESLRSLTPPVKPASMGHPIEREARFETDKIKRHFAENYGRNGIIFGATSGIDLDPKSAFQGPHVGSYFNMLFKRAILEAGREGGVPVMILADESKMPYKFEPDKCFPICDSELPWKSVCEEVPLAIVCAFQSEKNKTGVISQLKEFGLTHEESEREGQTPWCTILSNDRFWAMRAKWIRASTKDEDYEDEMNGENPDASNIHDFHKATS